MGTKTGIEWTDATWNPILGCSRVSEGCRNCYAEGIAARFANTPGPYEGLAVMANGHPQWTGKISETKQLLNPLKWCEPKRIFVNSMSDLFHPNVTRKMLLDIAGVMVLAYWHTFQVLTKRPENAKIWTDVIAEAIEIMRAIQQRGGIGDRRVFRALDMRRRDKVPWTSPLPNVWLGVSDEGNQHKRIDVLRQVSAVVRFISAEPLIFDPGEIDLTGIDWVIVGGESGPGARPMHPEWARSLRDQCVAANVPFFFKQWGEWIPSDGYARPGTEFLMEEPRMQFMQRVGKKSAGALLDGSEWKDFPR